MLGTHCKYVDLLCNRAACDGIHLEGAVEEDFQILCAEEHDIKRAMFVCSIELG